MREYRYATVEYKTTKAQLKARGIKTDIYQGFNANELIIRTGLYLGIARYGDEDGADTYLMIIDSLTGFVIEVTPSKVMFVLDKGVKL